MTLPLSLLHPDGMVGHAAVFGSGDAAELLGPPPRTDGPADLLLLAPDGAERGNGAWIGAAVAAARRLATDGLVVAAGAPPNLRRALVRGGLRREARLLHVPNVATSRYVLPARGPTARYGLDRVISLRPERRLAARALAVMPLSPAARTTLIFRRPGDRPTLAWLCEVGQPVSGCEAIIRRSWKTAGGSVVHRFTGADAPDVVVKLGGEARREGDALHAIAPGAALDGVRVPGLIDQRQLGDVPLIVETSLSGTLARNMLRGSSSAADGLLRRVARWLAEWNRATRTQRALGADDAERMVLAPARALAPSWDGGLAYLERLKRLCERCVGTPAAFVASHNDLTAANVVMAEGGAIGIVDWERAERESLPLGDLVYAATDFAAAVDGYQDRSAAFVACFGADGSRRRLAGELVAEASQANGLGSEVAELCVHACWLGHADNERRDEEPSGERPFLAILRELAAMSGVTW